MKELTFREVIANIKEGEVWENKRVMVYLEDGDILNIEWKDGRIEEIICLYLDEKTRLQREKVSFQEAFKAYGEGKEIESCVSGAKINSELGHIMKNDYSFDNCENLFSFNEIIGEWYIN